MGRGRSKGKKLTVTNQDDPLSGEEEKIPAQKRRGRPQKPLKDDIDEDEAQKIEEEEVSEDTKSKNNGKKRRRNSQVKEKVDPLKGENVISTEESNKPNGFRPNGNRRKNNKPRRAAEAVVECS